jgi:hypothetical protein
MLACLLACGVLILVLVSINRNASPHILHKSVKKTRKPLPGDSSIKHSTNESCLKLSRSILPSAEPIGAFYEASLAGQSRGVQWSATTRPSSSITLRLKADL